MFCSRIETPLAFEPNDVMFFHLAPQSRPANTQPFGRFAYVPVGALKIA